MSSEELSRSQVSRHEDIMQTLRIREIKIDDMPTVRNIVVASMQSHYSVTMKEVILKNYRLQSILVAFSTVISTYLGYGILMFLLAYIQMIIVLYVIGFFSFTHDTYTRTRGMKRKPMETINSFIKFWVAEIEYQGQWYIIGSIGYRKLTLGDELLSDLDSSTAIVLTKLAVSSKLRRNGVGNRLLDHALNQAIEMNYEFVVLECLATQYAAISLYEKFGFKEKNGYRIPALFGISSKLVLTFFKALKD
uniref:N-acetyltransferase family 8 member 3-like n=1 Tax=Styela clava TaxID=7725 RepID=UPI00193983E6|nr:N-acetyltransferase family 8 member 3-like [Styela clava]